MTGDPRETLRLAQLAWPVARAAGGTLHLAGALVLGSALVLRGEAEPGDALQREARRLLEMDEQSLTGWFDAPAAQFELWLEHYEDARRLLLASTARIRAKGALTALPHPLVVLAHAEFHLGDWTVARAHADEAWSSRPSSTSSHAHRSRSSSSASSTARRAGSIARAAGSMRRTAWGRTEMGSTRTMAGWARGHVELSAGDNEAAIAVLAPAGAFSLERGLEEPGVAPWAQELAEAYIRAGRPAEAEDTLGVLAAQAEKSGRRLAHAGVARCRG